MRSPNPMLRKQLAKRGMKSSLDRALVQIQNWVVDIPLASAIAANGTVSNNDVKIDAGFDFIIHGVSAMFYRSTGVAGCPVAISSNPLLSSNDMPFLGQIRMQVQTQSSQWRWYNQAVRLDIAVSTQLKDLPLWQRPIVAGNDSLLVTITNDAPVPVFGQVVFHGGYYRRQ